jgi:hypothetical protein
VGVWPQRTGNPFTSVLDRTHKYVASRTLTEPLPWQNSTLLAGDAATVWPRCDGMRAWRTCDQEICPARSGHHRPSRQLWRRSVI